MKLKTVTIIHSATTETVRLPDESNGNGVIVHTAVRTKVPFKKKVRGERKKKHMDGTPRKATLNVATRQKKSTTQESPRKIKKKPKRSPSGVEAGGEQQQQQQPPTQVDEVPKATRRTKKPQQKNPKEIIDYSNPQQHLNTFGKVQKWLLESPIVASATSQFEHTSKSPQTTMINKSHSNPENLTTKPHRSPSKSKFKGMNSNKMRLQVVFKPPFKFSLKLSKNENETPSQNNRNRHENRKRNSIDNQLPGKRAALLIVNETEAKVVEPVYETLKNTKNSQLQRQKSIDPPNYENLPTTSSTANLIDATLNNSFSTPINTATFRVNKSSSGNNINNSKNLPVITTPVMKKSSLNATSSSSHQHHHQQQQQQKRRLSTSNSSSNLMKFGGSSQNLTRSSTTNLTKSSSGGGGGRHDGIKRRASDMNRSSTSNLTKHNRSNSNLRRGDSYGDVTHHDEKKLHSRKSSLSKSNSNITVAPTIANNAGSQQQGSSRREESFKNNIPRASLINNTIANALSNTPFQRQISFNFKPTAPLSHQSRMLIDEVNKNRPQTSSCDSSMFKNFEWPRVLSTQRSLPAENALQSDMEVMVSDGETLENDS